MRSLEKLINKLELEISLVVQAIPTELFAASATRKFEIIGGWSVGVGVGDGI